MLASPHRFPLGITKQAFQASYRGPLFVAKYTPNELSLSRFGFVISKKVDSRATGRNRLKRVMRAEIEGLLAQIKPGYDILFIIQKQAATTHEAELRRAVTNFLTDKGLIA